MTFIRYLSIQLIAYGIDMGVFMGTIYTGLFGVIAANVLGKIAAGVFAFLMHQNFTFRIKKNMRDRKQIIRYFFLLGINIPMSSAFLAALLLVTGVPIIAKLLSDTICVFLSFWLSKKWVFKSNRLCTPHHIEHDDSL